MTAKIIKKLVSVSFPLLVVCCSDKELVLKPRKVILENATQIVPITDSLVQPILYQDVPSFENYTIDESKEYFIAIVLPAVLIARHELDLERKTIKNLLEQENWLPEDSLIYNRIQKKFRAKNAKDLLERMTVHPNSITLAQAVVESGWGSSRFFIEGSNLFGIWAYRKDEPRIAANESGVYLRKYDDISQSIMDYYLTLGRANPYKAFRKARLQSTDVGKLLPHLKHYSERGKRYTDQLATIIRQNNLTQYDDYQLDPDYFFEQ